MRKWVANSACGVASGVNFNTLVVGFWRRLLKLVCWRMTATGGGTVAGCADCGTRGRRRVVQKAIQQYRTVVFNRVGARNIAVHVGLENDGVGTPDIGRTQHAHGGFRATGIGRGSKLAGHHLEREAVATISTDSGQGKRINESEVVIVVRTNDLARQGNDGWRPKAASCNTWCVVDSDGLSCRIRRNARTNGDKTGEVVDE